ncbi:S9 family peptidase [Aliidiomarina sanyensis]|uniref:S9 family peptidase n=1 Tax=Aliidiomarina sanyensis TaxID=1249555 RepID=A0A432WEN8_9GAMM|nr:prolyl oligopeptidase family serine peptidase [Aliidiomarina sanyensis]RUO31326.1 S9 family peptidase [Aliidiomarina sanyensis]
MKRWFKYSLPFALVAGLTATVTAPVLAEQARPLALTDVMQFREIEQRQMDKHGATIAFSATPDFGDREGIVVRVADGTTISVASAFDPKVSANGDWVVFTRQPTLLESERAESREELRALYHHAVVVDVQGASKRQFDQVSHAAFTGDGRFLLLQHDEDYSKEAGSAEGRLLRLIDLATQEQTQIKNVSQFTVAPYGSRFVYQQIRKETEGEGEDATTTQTTAVVLYNTENHRGTTLHESDDAQYNRFSFAPNGEKLAFHVASKESDYRETPQSLWLWQQGTGAHELNVMLEQHILSEHSPQRWSDDSARLFIGHRPTPEKTPESAQRPQTVDDLFDIERLRSDRRLQVWHGDDDMIIPHQRQSQRNLNRATTLSVLHIENNQLITLTTDLRENAIPTDHPSHMLIRDSRPYSRAITWDGFYHDLYVSDLRTGARQKVASGLPSFERGALSPDGRYVVFIQDAQLNAFDVENGSVHALATNAGVSWVDEENDRPMQPVNYGVGGFLADGDAVWMYDRFDIWQVPLAAGAHNQAVNLTRIGRDQQQQYRLTDTGDLDVIETGQPILLRAYNERDKTSGFHQLTVNASGASLRELIHGESTWRYLARSDDGETLFYTQENFRTFPDIWTARADMSEARQLTDVNPQRDEFMWGHASLVEWESTRGEPLQGVLIKPDNYDPNRTYPVLVYYYEKFSQRLYHWNQMRVNHRPNFPFYVGQEYVVFLPDVHFRLGAPGPSATESLVPGVEKIIEMGVADPDAIGLHGHSWSGYQTAFVVTETDMFAAAVSGAPVSNMTSAYSGIRWGTGLARQFQYEKGQSRLGVSMFEDLDPYIKNSPVFFADRINTPMLIQFGDKDEAVPWEQGIEYYLALRRLDKPVVMLHYEGEPHHLQQFANKIDYTIKMLEFFDHYLKGEEAPEWWTDGLEFQVYD